MTQRYFVPKLPIDGEVLLPEEEASHAARVMRVKIAETLVLFDGNNHEATASVTAVDRRSVACEIQQHRVIDREAKRDVLLAVGMPKGDRGRSVIERAVELGAKGLIPLNCTRSVALPGKGFSDRAMRYVIDASKQCGRNRLMQIHAAMDWQEFIAADFSPRLGVGPDTAITRVVAHPCDSEPSETPAGPIVIAIGPEGGFSDAEIQQAQQSGWTSVGLGPRILRVETAVSALTTLAVRELI